MTFTPTPEQSAIVTAATDTTDNLLVAALAGAAKTSTLIMIANALPKVNTICLAFNKKIAVEMQDKLPPNCKAQTLNSLGLAVWGNTIGKRCKTYGGKNYQILKDLFAKLPKDEQDDAWQSLVAIRKAMEQAKSGGHIPDDFHDAQPRKCNRLLSDSTLWNELETEPTDWEWRIIIDALNESARQAFDGLLDFGDQLLFPSVYKSVYPIHSLILIDEAQDLSELNHLMLAQLYRKRIIAVGDQCQPAGTMVTVVDKPADRWNAAELRQVPIEDLVEGDRLLGYNGEGSFMYNRSVEGISDKAYAGNMITVETQLGDTSTYTDNHHCYANFEPFRNHFALYLMRSGDKFRIGRCRMEYESGSGPTRRAICEGADAYWLLGLYGTEREAALEEAVAQAQFGIPDITFICPNTNAAMADQEYLDEAWAYILASVDLKHRANKCLSYYSRNLQYPIWETGGNAKVSLLRPMVTRACNLISGCKMLPFYGESKITKDAWVIVEITSEYTAYTRVYSLTVSDNHLYVADNLVTHNCQAIYGFRGAFSEGMEEMKVRFGMREFPLSISFRCPTQVVNHVLWRAPHMKSWEGSGEGTVRRLTTWSFEDLPETCTIICRNNAPLLSMAVRLLSGGRYPKLWGNDIAAGLIKILKSFGPLNMDSTSLMYSIADYEEQQLKKARNTRTVQDKCECLRILARGGEDLGAVLDHANQVFNSSGQIDLCTGHKAKGAEFRDVFFLDEHLIHTDGQEPNLRYVIATRAMENLTYITSEGCAESSNEAEAA